MFKNRALLTAFLLLAGQTGFALYAKNPWPANKSLVVSAQEARKAARNEQDDEAGGIEIAEKYRTAMGIKEDSDPAKSPIKTIEIQSENEALGRLNKLTRITERETGRFYQRTEGPNDTIEMGFDGKRVWQKAPFFRGYLPDNDPTARRIIESARNDGLPLVNYKKTGRKLYRLPNETIEGKEYLVVKSAMTLLTEKDAPVKFYLDPATYFLKRMVTGVDITQTTIFDDYRQTEGRGWMAFTTTTINPQVTVVQRIKSVKHNIPVDPSLFEFKDDSGKPETAKPANGEGAPPLPAAAPPEEEIIPEANRLEAFELIWNKVNDTYWDRTFNGIDWKAVHDKYAPLVKATSKSKEFHQLLSRMVGELKLSHFRVSGPENVVGFHTRAEDRKSGGIGVGLRWLDGQLVVVDIEKDYPAYEAGIRKGFVITKIDGRTPEEIYQESRKKGGFELREGLARVRAVGELLAGKLDVPVKLEVLNEQDKPLQLEVKRKIGRLLQLEFESKKLDGNVGYIVFNVFFGDLLAKFQAALQELRDTQALIIDLRGNPGGAGDLATAIANRLSAGEGSLGNLRFRYATEPYSYKGTGDQAYKGKVILLVDEGSGSTAEVFSGGMQENKRATVIGAPTAGAVLPSLMQMLPTGGVLVHVISNFQTPKGVVLEGRGVIPDIAAKLSRQAVLAGRDPALERAIQFAQTGK